MSFSFVLLLVTALVVAYATSVTLRRPIPPAARLAVVALYALLGIHTVLLVWWFGDGRLLPGFQLNPEIRNYYQARVAAGAWPAPEPALSFVALLAHVIALLPRPNRAGFSLLLPVTLFFVWTFFHFREEATGKATEYRRAVGPEDNAYLTLAPTDDGVRLIFARAAPDATLARVLHVHEAEGRPPQPRLFWTKDGQGVVFMVRRRRLFALDLKDGGTVGAIPSRSHEWPATVESLETRRVFTRAERDVAEFVRDRGGIYVD